MAYPFRRSASTSNRKLRTSLGCRTFYRRDCDRRFNERSGTPFNGLQFPNDIALMAVLWRLRYKLEFHDVDVAELLLQRGFEVSYETIRVWEFRFAPLVNTNLRTKRRRTAGHSWYLDETYIKVSGRWRYLYKAIDREGNLLASMLREHRGKHATRRFLRRLIDSAGQKPLRMTTDKDPACTMAFRWIVGRKVLHRHNRDLNNRIEQKSSRNQAALLSNAWVQTVRARESFL